MSGCTAKNNKEALNWNYKFRYIMAQQPTLEGSFSITPFGEPFYPPGLKPVYSKKISCQLQASGLTPNTNYMLFCPNTGDPYRPESELIFRTDENGFMCLLDQGEMSSIPFGLLYLELAAMPGFASDWFLISLETKKALQFTFIYQPIQAKTSEGQELMLCKKDCGGNFIEIYLKGFTPHEKIHWSGKSEDQVISDALIMDETGSGMFLYNPKIPKSKKGTATISVLQLKETLKVSCDWDYSTLSIKRISPPSLFRQNCKKLPGIIGEKALSTETL
jgi:hypothetical protein